MLRVLIVKKWVSYRPSSVVMYSDASNIACGAYSVEIESKVFELAAHWWAVPIKVLFISFMN
jgi:hypothetical protein